MIPIGAPDRALNRLDASRRYVRSQGLLDIAQVRKEGLEFVTSLLERRLHFLVTCFDGAQALLGFLAQGFIADAIDCVLPVLEIPPSIATHPLNSCARPIG